ncbi:MAG: hypothetical protein ACE5E6_08900 [Phycisphaerae bacterium]
MKLIDVQSREPTATAERDNRIAIHEDQVKYLIIPNDEVRVTGIERGTNWVIGTKSPFDVQCVREEWFAQIISNQIEVIHLISRLRPVEDQVPFL